MRSGCKEIHCGEAAGKVVPRVLCYACYLKYGVRMEFGGGGGCTRTLVYKFVSEVFRLRISNKVRCGANMDCLPRSYQTADEEFVFIWNNNFALTLTFNSSLVLIKARP